MEMIFIIGVLFLLFCLAFDLGREWERMEWDGSFNEQEAAQNHVQADATPRCSRRENTEDVHTSGACHVFDPRR